MYSTTGFSREIIVGLCTMIHNETMDDRRPWPPILGLFKSVTVTLNLERAGQDAVDLEHRGWRQALGIQAAVQPLDVLRSEPVKAVLAEPWLDPVARLRRIGALQRGATDAARRDSGQPRFRPLGDCKAFCCAGQVTDVTTSLQLADLSSDLGLRSAHPVPAVRETQEETGNMCEITGLVGIYTSPKHVGDVLWEAWERACDVIEVLAAVLVIV
jgi:hypothetical protein